MESSSSIYAWLQQPPHPPESSRHPPHSSDWPKQQPAQSAASPQQPHQQPPLDLSDFTSLSDLPVASSSSAAAASSAPPQSSPFYQFTSHAGFFGNSQYFPSGWPASQQSHSHSPEPIPLSNYSTLNGATSANSASSHQQQQAPPMMIDPALTTMNGSGSNGSHHSYSQSSNFAPTGQQPQQQQQRPLSQQQYSLYNSFPMSYYHLSQQQQQQQPTQPQGTLSPHALHAPTTNNSLMGAYYQPQTSTSKSPQQQHQTVPQSPPGQTPQERKAAMLAGIRPLLQSSAFSGAGGVQGLVARIFDFGVADVDAATRLEMLTKIRDGAGNHYFRAWAENSTAMDITREWLKAAFTANREGSDTDGLGETIMPLLHIIDRLPMTVESLKTSKLGKIVVKLVKDPPSPAIKDMASNVERRWRQMVTEKQPEAVADDPKSKKRKLADPPARSSAPPLKKAATGTAARPVVKKEKEPLSTSKSSAPAVKDAKSDSSFFSAPKPKPKLPSFKKAPPAPVVKKEDAVNIAQPSAIDPFQEALKSMKTRKGSPLAIVSTPSPHGSAGAGDVNMAAPSATTASGKPRKTVTWAPDDKLESVRLIERAIYGDENSDGGVYSSHSVRDLDRSEGAALHMHLFEETIDWTEPLPIEIPAEIPNQGRGGESQEKATQEQREQTALVSLYMSTSSIPDSPAEPSQMISDEEVDKDVREMTAGPEVDAVFWSGPPIPVQQDPPPNTSVADLVGQLAVEGDAASHAAAAAAAADPMMQQLPPEQLQQLLAQIAQAQIPQPMHLQQQQQQQQYGDWPGLNQFSADYGQHPSFQEDGGERNGNGWFAGRGGRGRGRGRGRGGAGIDEGYRPHNKRRLCNFFAAGRCKYGDQCDYSHDMSY